MTTRKAYTNVIKVVMLVIMFFSAMSIACDDPNPNPLVSPRTEIETMIIQAVDTDCTDNVLSGC